MLKSKIYPVILFLIILVACQGARETPLPPVSPVLTDTDAPAVRPSETAEPPQATATLTPAATDPLVLAVPSIAPLSIDWTDPFAGELFTGGYISLTNWTPQPYPPIQPKAAVAATGRVPGSRAGPAAPAATEPAAAFMPREEPFPFITPPWQRTMPWADPVAAGSGGATRAWG